MALINGKPFLEYLLNFLTGQGIRKVILSVGFRQEVIRDHFSDHFKTLTLSYAIEEEPLGTGGGILNALSQVEEENVFTLNGDSMFRIDLRAMQLLHTSSGADITIALSCLEDPSRYGKVKIDHEKRIIGFSEKDQNSSSGYINGGIYLINKSFFMKHAPGLKFSIEHEGFEMWRREAKIYGYPAKGYFIDIGVPDDYMAAQDEFKRFED